jgi:SAM-dependent methyltransferase
MTGEPPGGYALRGDRAWDERMQSRQAMKEAGFLIPFLTEGMSIVDVGCGQGTITTDLAEIVAPGLVRGFDLQKEHIEKARTLAKDRGLTNAQFEVGDVYAPPFDKDSCDLAFAHMVFMHLPDPEEALRKVIDLVKPGGLIATKDRGAHNHILGRNSDHVKRASEIASATIDAGSGNPFGMGIGEVMNRLCREAGLDVIQVSASLDVRLASTRTSEPLRGPFGQRAIEAGVTTQAELDEVLRQIEEWRSDPDAYYTLDAFEVVSRKVS